MFVLPYRSVPFAVAFRAACSVSAHPVAALHQQDICVFGIPHVVHADHAQGIVVLTDRFETGELACVGRLPAHWGVAAYRSSEDVSLGLPLASAWASSPCDTTRDMSVTTPRKVGDSDGG